MNAHTFAAVVALLVVLAFSSSAWAECAWVLWTREGNARGPGSSDWSVVHAVASRAECVTSLEKLAAGFEGVTILGDIRAGSFIAKEKASGWSYFGKGLPDTVDPRGPKGK